MIIYSDGLFPSYFLTMAGLLELFKVIGLLIDYTSTGHRYLYLFLQSTANGSTSHCLSHIFLTSLLIPAPFALLGIS